MHASATANQTINIPNNTTQQTVEVKAKQVKKHTLWEHTKEDKGIQAMLVVVAASVITNIMVFL